MKYVFPSISILVGLLIGGYTAFVHETTYGQTAPYFNTVRGEVPATDSEYYSGTTTPTVKAWKGIVTDGLLFTGLLSKGCIGTDGSGNVIEGTCTGGSGGGAGNSKFATTTDNISVTPNGGGGIIVSSSSTIDRLTQRLATTTSATTTNFYISNLAKYGNNYLATTTTVCAWGCDYTDIDTAVDSVAASTTILIKNGTYALGAGTITVTAGKTLEIIGESKDGVIITYSGGGSAFTIGGSGADTRHFRMENITLIGTSNGTRGFSFVRVKNSVFKNLRSTGFSSTGNPGQAFRLDGTGSYTGDNYFYNLQCDTSEYCLNLSGTAVNSNHFYGFNFRTTKSSSGARGIALANANGNSFHGGLVGGSTRGIDFTGSGDENAAYGVYCEDNTTCVVFQAGAKDNNVNVIDVETNTTLVTDAGSENSFSATGDNGFYSWNSSNFGIGTSTPAWNLHVASSTFPQLTISDGSLTSNHWSFRNAGGLFYLATSSATTFSTSTVSALSINANGQMTVAGGFVATLATSTHATSTNLYVSGIASTSALYLATGACDTLDVNSTGLVVCGTDAQGGASAYDAWTHPSAGVSATTSRMIFDSASSTFTRDLNITGNSTTTHATTTTIAATTHATTSSLTVSGNTTLSQLTSALILTGADGLAAEYAGTSCTNQFVRSLSALGAATCATVGTADVSGLDISDDTNLAATWPVVLTGDTLSLGFSTSTALAANNILYATAVNTFGSEAAFTYDPTLNRLTATQASFTLSTTTSATSTNLYAGTASSTNLWAINSVFASTTIGKSTTTQATSTNLFATTASSTNLFGSDFNFGNIFTKVVNAFTAVGTWDFGGADGVEIPNGSSPTVDAIGELALDTTKNMLLIATSTNSSYPATFPNEKVLWSRTLATTSFEYINNKVYLPPKQFAVTATRILCYIAGSNTASVPINLSNSAGSADTNTATCTKTAPSALGTTTTTNVNFAAGTANIIELGTKTTMTNNDAIVFTVYGTIDRE